MKFEFCSRFRNRNLYPHCGAFAIETTQTPGTARNAQDPCCSSAPMISWTAGTNIVGTITSFSVYDNRNIELLISFGAAVPLQVQTVDFLAGCILSSATLQLRIQKSLALSPTLLAVTCPYIPDTTITVGQAVTIQDYTTFNPINIRAPTNFDVGQYNILYNETVNSYLNIINVDLDTRRLNVVQTTAPGWSSTDNLNIRSDVPIYISPITASTVNTVTLVSAIPTSNIGNWIRMRLSNYSNQLATNSWARQIVNIVGNVITFYPSLSAPPSIFNTYEILAFSYDNANPLQLAEQAKNASYNIWLETLSIPNVPIYNGDLRSIPYLLVELVPENSPRSNQHLISSNNPLVTQSVWVAKIDNSETFDQKYLRFNTTKTKQKPQKLFLNIYEPMCLIIRLPNGVVFRPTLSDTLMPQQAWQDLNLNAVFEFEQVEEEEIKPIIYDQPLKY